MVEVSYPGVYIQEVPSGVHTIMGVSTSIGAFIGRATSGPTDIAIRCLSWSDYERTFGAAHPKNRLAQSVRQFFANGGTDCYVVRLAPGAVMAEVTLKNLGDISVLKATAKSKGKWGNNLRLQVDYNTTNPDETFNLHVLLENEGEIVSKESFTALSMDEESPRFAPDFVTQSSSLIKLEKGSGYTISTFNGYSESRRPFKKSEFQPAFKDWLETAPEKIKNSFIISVDDGKPKTIVLTKDIYQSSSDVDISDADTILDNINIQINTQLHGYGQVKCQFNQLNPNQTDPSLSLFGFGIYSDTIAKKSVRIQRAPTNDLAGVLMLGVEQGGFEPIAGYENRPVPTALYYAGDTTGSPNKLAIAALISNFTLAINGSTPVIVPLLGDPWFKELPTSTSVSNQNDGVRQKLGFIADAVNNDATLPFKAEVWGYHLALIPKKGTISSSLTLDTNITSWTTAEGVESEFISNVYQYPLGITGLSIYAVPPTIPGRDESPGIQLEPVHYFGSINEQTGIHALDSVDIFNLMVIPYDEEIDKDQRLSIYGECSNYCKEKRAFLLMDAPASWTDNSTGRPKATENDINQFRAQVVKDYSAVFYPNIICTESGIKKSRGPSGTVAGIFARTDSTRGVWKAPAGIDATMTGVVDLQVNLTDRENGVYNKLGVNCLRIFPNGFVNWGARTMAGFDTNTTDWKYIPIRRLALYIEESLFRGTKWVVFEPNDEPLWASIRLNIGAFMMNLFRQGAFQGTTPEKAFYVKCNKETTTQDDRNRGIVNIEVGFAPLKPAEFVVIKIQQIAGEL